MLAGDIRTVIHTGDDGKVAFQRVQDVEAILEHNKALQGERQNVSGDNWHHIAEIPCIFLEQWLNEEYARGNTSLKLWSPEMDKLVKRKLASSDWAWLRTTDRKF